jgi:hypothetical protein
MKIDEYVPEATPIIIASAKSRRVSPPKTSSIPIRKTVERPVISDRVRTSLIERLTIWENAARGIRGTFSRIRSKTMIVSYIE